MPARLLCLDLWQALHLDPADFFEWMEDPRVTVADAWAQLLAAVRGKPETLRADTNPPAPAALIAVAEARRAAMTTDDFPTLAEIQRANRDHLPKLNGFGLTAGELADHRDRLTRARETLDRMAANTTVPGAAERLTAKATGVALALDYLRSYDHPQDTAYHIAAHHLDQLTLAMEEITANAEHADACPATVEGIAATCTCQHEQNRRRTAEHLRALRIIAEVVG